MLSVISNYISYSDCDWFDAQFHPMSVSLCLWNPMKSPMPSPSPLLWPPAPVVSSASSCWMVPRCRRGPDGDSSPRWAPQRSSLQWLRPHQTSVRDWKGMRRGWRGSGMRFSGSFMRFLRHQTNLNISLMNGMNNGGWDSHGHSMCTIIKQKTWSSTCPQSLG